MATDPRDDSIAISGSERLARMEQILERIDGKLEAKVDKGDFIALELRVRDIELHGSSGLQTTVHDVASLKVQAATDAMAIRDQVSALQRKAAYLAGGLTVIIFAINLLTGHGIGHL